MPAVPSFMLKKLYLKGSLKNTEEGFQFQIRNTLAPGTISAIVPLVVDGTTYPLTGTVIMAKETITASEISKEKLVIFPINSVVTMMVKGVKLAAGEHTIVIGVMTREAGELKWDVADTVA
jgi:hydroxymethylglutaryl-CoA reductase (NADPH)